MALSMVRSFLIHAVMASLNGFPAFVRRSYIALIGGLCLIADRVVMYSTQRTSARPPRMYRAPCRLPLSSENGAKPTSAEIFWRFSVPNSGNFARSENVVTSPTPGTLSSSVALLHHTGDLR